MDINDRIVYSKEAMLRSMESALDELRVFRYDGRYRKYFGDIFVDKFSYMENEIIRRKDEPFNVVVAGAFKRGKSTLINALLKENVVTMDVTPETVTTNRISYGIHANEALLSGNRRIKIADNELKREKLEKTLKELPEPATELEIHRPLDILKKINIVDTPGTDDAMRDYSGTVKKVLLRADAVIYVFDVKHPLSMTEQFFIRSSVLPQKLTDIFVVGNFTNDLNTLENVNRVKDTSKSRLTDLLPEAKIYMVSALDELSKHLGEGTVCPELSDFLDQEFLTLRSDINSMVEEKADGVGVARFQKMLVGMIYDLSVQLQNIEEGLRMSEVDAQAAMEKFNEQKEINIAIEKDMQETLHKQIESMQDETKRWMRDFLDRIVDETQNLYGEDTQTLRKYYEYYCIDLLQQALNVCLEHHREQLYDILRNLAAPLSDKFSDVLSVQDTYQFRFKLDNRIWTKGDTAGLAVSLLGKMPFLATIGLMAADGITGYIRERELRNRTPILIEQINKKMTALSVSINKTIEGIYQSMEENMKKIVVDYMSEEMATKEELLRQTVNVSHKNEERKTEISALLSEATNIIAKARAKCS